MKLLCSSSDLRELERLVKRLVHVGIPCAVCKDSVNSQLSVWVQQDNDFPLALKIFVDRDAPRPLPPWAELLDSPALAAEGCIVRVNEDSAMPAAGGMDNPSVVVIQLKGSTRTGSA